MKHLRNTAALAAHMALRPAGVAGSVRMDAGGTVEKLLAEVNAEVKRVGDEVKKTAEEALNQAKKSGGVTEEVKARADELLVAQKKLDVAQAKLEGRLEQLETRSTDVEQRLAERRGDGAAPQSFGEQAAKHDDVRAFAKNGSRGTMRVTVPVRQAITSVGTSAGGLIRKDRDTELVQLPRRRMTVRDLLDQGETTSNMVEYARMTARTNLAAPVAETTLKPESDYTWTMTESPVRTIAHWVPVSRQAMDDIPQLETTIDGELRYGLQLREELQLLKGDGTGQNLSGLVANATAYVAAFTPAAKTLVDDLRLAILQVALSEYDADGIVLTPTDWARIETLKDGENRYLFASVIQMLGPQLWGRPVVATQSMDVDKFLVGAFRMAATIYDRMEIEVLFSSEDRDNFVKNMITARAEERLALAVKRSQALVYGDFGFVA